jgi:hypothetical protein
MIRFEKAVKYRSLRIIFSKTNSGYQSIHLICQHPTGDICAVDVCRTNAQMPRIVCSHAAMPEFL